MKASDLFIRCLEKEGVEYIFGVPGEENADVMMSLLESTIQFVVCRHEQAAAFMADAYGRLMGKPAVCLGTLGPGATNLLTGVADANMDRAPLVVVTGQGSTRRLHKESHQAMDIVSMFRPVVKWTTSVSNADAIPEIIRKAFKLACTEKMGATHIELPEDIAKQRTLAKPLIPDVEYLAEPNRIQILEAVKLLREADFPVILAGNGVLRDRATDVLTRLVDQTNMPVLNTFMGKGAIPASNPRCLFTLGLQSRDFIAQALEEADVVVAVGYDMVEYHPLLWNRGRPKKIVCIDFVPGEVDSSFNIDVDIQGDIATSLLTLAEELGDAHLVESSRYAEYRQVMEHEFAEYQDDTAFPLKPQKILSDVRKVMGDDDILLSDVAPHKMWIARYYQCEGPNTCLISNGFCTMGFALPGSIGAKLSHPDRRVLSISGDGGVMMNIQDLETAVRLRIPIVAMIWTDSEYGLIKWKQEAQYGTTSHIGFTNPDFVKLADAFGAIGMRVQEASQLRKILADAFEQAEQRQLPVLIDCPVDYAENMKLSRRLGELACAERTCLLAEVPMFSGVSGEHLELIADSMDQRSFSAGETVFNLGDPGKEFFVVVSGEAEIQWEDKAPIKLGKGGGFGEVAILGDRPRMATVVAGKEGAEMLVLTAGDFNEIVLSQPEFGLHMLQVVTSRLAENAA